MSPNDYVILFKSVSDTESEDEDEYCCLFRSHFQVTLVPVLDFEFINLNILLDKLKKPDDYEGIIFSSPRCVTGVEKSVHESGNLPVLNNWAQHKHFVVGEKTAHRIEKLGFVASGAKAGNANKLAEIMSRDHFNKPFLYPRGSLTKDTFKSTLEENGIKTDDIIIYKTKPHPELKTNIRNVKCQTVGKATYFAYFSPSGVNFTLPILQMLQFDLNQIKFIAIGATTAKALVENGLEVSVTSSKPEPHSLLEAIKSLTR